MHLTLTAVSWITELVTPSPTVSVDPDTVTPTIVGFAATAVVAAAVVFLVIDMLRRIRRAGYRADIAAELDAEEAARADAAAEPADGEDQDTAGSGR